MMDWQALFVTLAWPPRRPRSCASSGCPCALVSDNPLSRPLPAGSAVTLPLVLPPTVLGFYLLILLSPTSPLGLTSLVLTGRRLPFTFAGILLGSVIGNLPFAGRPFIAAFAGVDRRLIEASWCLARTQARHVSPRHTAAFGLECSPVWC